MSERMADPESVVERVTSTISSARGRVLSTVVREQLADEIASQFPGLLREEVDEILSNPMHVDQPITPELARERANQIALIIIGGQFRARDRVAGQPIVAGVVAVDRHGEVLFAGQIGGAS